MAGLIDSVVHAPSQVFYKLAEYVFVNLSNYVRVFYGDFCSLIAHSSYLLQFTVIFPLSSKCRSTIQDAVGNAAPVRKGSPIRRGRTAALPQNQIYARTVPDRPQSARNLIRIHCPAFLSMEAGRETMRYFAISSQNRMRMVAACALVALVLGEISDVPTPWRSSSLTAHWSALSA